MSELDNMKINNLMSKYEKLMEAQLFMLTKIHADLKHIEHRLDVPIKEKKEPSVPDIP